MSREIKFRAWDTQTKSYISPEHLYIECTGKLRGWGDNPIADGRFVLQQYTGLKDKNGMEIYEGDLIKLNRDMHPFYPDIDIIGEVFWSNMGAEWMHTYHDNRPPKKMFVGCEVIGNIYENPELLT